MTLTCPPPKTRDGPLQSSDLNGKLIYLTHNCQTSYLPLRKVVKPIVDYCLLLHLFKVPLNFSYLLAYTPNDLVHLLLPHCHFFRPIHNLFSKKIFSFFQSFSLHKPEITLIVFEQQISFLIIVSWFLNKQKAL